MASKPNLLNLQRQWIIIGVILFSMLFLVFLGYFFGSPSLTDRPASARVWFWPSLPLAQELPPMPARLYGLWPMAKEVPRGSEFATVDAARKAGARQGKQQNGILIAIITQGGGRQALLLGPDAGSLALRPGMVMPDGREVLAINADSLQWRDAQGKEGTLYLYPPAKEGDYSSTSSISTLSPTRP